MINTKEKNLDLFLFSPEENFFYGSFFFTIRSFKNYMQEESLILHSSFSEFLFFAEITEVNPCFRISSGPACNSRRLIRRMVQRALRAFACQIR